MLRFLNKVFVGVSDTIHVTSSITVIRADGQREKFSSDE